MKKENLSKFLSDKSMFELERSLGADCVKFIPERIKGYQENIKTCANQISIFEDMIDDKTRRLNELETQKGLKFLLHSKQIKAEKLALAESIAQLENNIRDFKNMIKTFDKLCAKENKKLESIKNSILDAGLTIEEVENEYHRLHEYLEAKEIAKRAVGVQKKDRIEQNRKSYSSQSALEKFNSRMKKHNDIVNNQSESQPGDN